MFHNNFKRREANLSALLQIKSKFDPCIGLSKISVVHSKTIDLLIDRPIKSYGLKYNFCFSSHSNKILMHGNDKSFQVKIKTDRLFCVFQIQIFCFHRK